MAVTELPESELPALFDRLQAEGRVVHLETLPGRAAVTAELHHPLDTGVRDRLGVDDFWSHQVQAIDAVRQGQSVVVATGTASGKSLCYQAPIAEAAVSGLRPTTALLLFPTKALAQDQLRALHRLDIPRLVPATYDGDSTPDERSWVRSHANVLLTNPEMLHGGILPHHNRWATFLKRLRYIVIDELHVLRGIFGSHVAHLLRRLRRLCAHYGTEPTFVFTSATIGEPGRLASELCGLDVLEITDDGSPQGERLVALLDPPVLDVLSGARPSSRSEAGSVMADLVASGHRTIAFCRSRAGTELLAADARRHLPDHLGTTLRSYRAGYLPAERREIEDDLHEGRIRGVVATSALELGVDIGGLDACVIDGFPGTIASLWQQMGRAGRDGAQSAAVLVAGDDQLDRWYVHHPSDVFTRPPEPAVINPANRFVARPHLSCAAFEKPLTHDDEKFWPGLLDDMILDLVRSDDLIVRPRGRTNQPTGLWNGRGFPAHGVGLRSGSSAEFRIVDTDHNLIGTVDGARAHSVVHPGAVYLHQGQPWRVLELDDHDRTAIVEPCTDDISTHVRSSVSISVLATDDARPFGHGTHLHLGSVEVTTLITGYQIRDLTSRRMIGHESLELTPVSVQTRGVWYTHEPELFDDVGLSADQIPGTLHAVEHAAIAVLPLFAICDRWDVGGVSSPMQADTGRPTVFIHDGHQGGTGIAELAWEAAPRHLTATHEVISQCGCVDGCPSCVHSPKCGNNNDPLDKAGAIDLLAAVLDGPAD
ncbi:MAG: DEAD/DEAH box helicase [Actinomycetia bacterium]|nr:DEAD/DEAH box helicase [Actinomycetes bacterium]MCP3913659.1 DEAD/DEAH box helicase [Actinomycetes bacterium]MCP4086847.1 DEAD/DEAH box helicase [Actinomycetes bacterium]